MQFSVMFSLAPLNHSTLGSFEIPFQDLCPISLRQENVRQHRPERLRVFNVFL